jgi:predicted RNA-binding protein with PUA-like domain
MKYWLMKSEPEEFSIDDLKRDKTSLWTGVRNYQARNFMMKDMSVGDRILFYHSSCDVPGVVGLAQVSKPAVEDPLQFDKKSKYYDPKATKDKPIWFCVEVKFLEKFKSPYTLSEIKTNSKLKDMLVIKRGMRLSIQPVEKKDYELIQKASTKGS